MAPAEPHRRESHVVGAYGLRLTGVDGAESLLGPADADWPSLAVEWEPSSALLEREDVTDEWAHLRLHTGGSFVVDRRGAAVRFSTPRRLTRHELVHPFLAPAAAVMSHWHRRSCLHAGGLVLEGRAWALIGDREGGKSSTLAWLALQGQPVLADDVLVVEEKTAFAGPRAVDLRLDASQRLGAGTALGRIGARDRFRMELPPIEGRVPLGGWVFLRWSDAVSVRRIAPSELLDRLFAQRALRVVPSNPLAWLELATLPAWELSRPQEWSLLPQALAVLFDALSADG